MPRITHKDDHSVEIAGTKELILPMGPASRGRSRVQPARPRPALTQPRQGHLWQVPGAGVVKCATCRRNQARMGDSLCGVCAGEAEDKAHTEELMNELERATTVEELKDVVRTLMWKVLHGTNL